MMRTNIVGLLLCLGCAQWEELPAGATGFLTVEEATLSGTIGGVRVDGPADASGYCTNDGWILDLRIDGENGSVMSAVDIRSLFNRAEELTATFRAGVGNEMQLESSTVREDPWSPSVASAIFEGCAGPDDGEWTVEEYAEVAVIDIEFPGADIEFAGANRMEVTYEAQFPNGDVLMGAFQSEMPFRD